MSSLQNQCCGVDAKRILYVIIATLLLLSLYITRLYTPYCNCESHTNRLHNHVNSIVPVPEKQGLHQRNSTENEKTRVQYISEKTRQIQGQIWVHWDAPLAKRLEHFNQVVSEQRREAIANNTTTQTSLQPTARFIYYDENTYLRRLAQNIPSVVTVFLELIGVPLDEAWDSR